jgi:hypothetical protein
MCVKELLIRLLIVSILFGGLASVVKSAHPEPIGDTYYVAPDGVDNTNNGTRDAPWRTIGYALEQIPREGGTIIALDGTYNECVLINYAYNSLLHIKAANPYRAKLQCDEASPVVKLLTRAENVTIEGFEITRPDPSATGWNLVVIDGRSIDLRNNIIHDVYNNDLLRAIGWDDWYVEDVTIEGNMFYNQAGNDEHIDVNSNCRGVVIQDNIFFNDFAGSGREIPESFSFIVIKNSAETSTRNITVRRNIFLNWEGASKDFVLVGEDGIPVFEAEDVIIENNLMLGNSSDLMQAPIGVRGSKNVTVRANTIVGDLPAWYYGIISYIIDDNLRNENLRIHNNIWSDPTGTMGDEFSCCDTSQVKSFSFDNNLFFNGGEMFPVSDDPFVEVVDDAHRIEGDPRLGDQHEGITLPRWNGASFDGGYWTIREAFEDLVARYGAPGPGSAAIDVADPAHVPTDDILGRVRSDIDDTPDIGAYEAGSIEFSLVVRPTFCVISFTDSATYELSLEADFFRGPVSIAVGIMSEDIDFALEPAVVSVPGKAVLAVTSTSTLSDAIGVYVHVPIMATGGGQIRSYVAGLMVGGMQVYLPVVLKVPRITMLYLPLIIK